MSQLDVALEAAVSSRHLSFVETGRARPSRELVLHLARFLDVPVREQNTLLLAAGYAPAFTETPLDAPEFTPVREALERILRAHEPFPAVVVDGRWNVELANAPALVLLSAYVDPDLLGAPANALRLSLHPRGLAPRIANFDEYAAHLLHRLSRQRLLTGDAALMDLEIELRGYPNVAAAPVRALETTPALFVPLVLRTDDAILTLFSTIATFGTAVDITVAELAIESFFPADRETAAALERLAP